MLLKRITLFSLIILSLYNVESRECAENVGNRYGIEATIIDGVVTGPPPYTTQNTFCPTNCGQCTAFAWGRALDRLGIITTFSLTSGRHACTWPDIITNPDIFIETDYTKPRANSFIIWGYEDPCNENSSGHVAYVEEVSGNDIYLNEANIFTYTPDGYGGGYDGYTKKLTISEIVSRTGVGGPFKAYVYLNNPFSNYWYWNFDHEGTEDWNAREALNQGIYQSEYWQIGASFGNNTSKRGVVSPILNNINTDYYRAMEIKFAINNMFLEKIDAYFKINNLWSGPFDMNLAAGSRALSSQNIYRINIPSIGQVQQVRIDFVEGSSSSDVRIYIDYVKFLAEALNASRVPSQYATIQAAIDATPVGGTVIVADGIYKGNGNKNLDFKGKAIIVKSENGPKNCIIDCENNGRGFYFHSEETQASVLSGFKIINGNVSDHNGGGILIYGSSPKIIDCILENNYSIYNGGGISFQRSSGIIDSCIVKNNKAKTHGGGIFIATYNSGSVINCLIYSNEAAYENTGGGGGGICAVSYSNPMILNCTISNNSAMWAGGVSSFQGSNISISNSIIWDNIAYDFANEIFIYGGTADYPSSVSAEFSDVRTGEAQIQFHPEYNHFYWGSGNIDVDPEFHNFSIYDFHLNSTSPCINMGTSNGSPILDFEGEKRPQGVQVDIGADEYNFSDFDEDRDVDGFDLASHIYNLNGVNIEEFSSNFGRTAHNR